MLKPQTAKKVRMTHKIMSRIKRLEKRVSQRTLPNSMEVFKWLLRNGMNKANIDGVKTKVLIPHSWKLYGSMEDPDILPTLKASNKSNKSA